METLQAVALVLAVALVAASLPRVQGESVSVQLWFALGGALASAAILFVVWAVRSDGRLRGSFYVEPTRYRGLRIGFGGFCVAMLGWLIAVFISNAVGYWVVVLGFLIGFIGMIVHFVIMLTPTKQVMPNISIESGSPTAPAHLKRYASRLGARNE